MLDFIRWLRFRWEVHPDIAVGDSKYGTIDNIVALFEEGILPMTPRPDFQAKTEFYSRDQFQYDGKQDIYICPEGHPLTKQGQYKANRSYIYRGKTKICNACPVKTACTTNKRGRTIHRSFYQDELDRAAELREMAAYHKAMRKRQVWVEPMFGEAEQWHGLRRFRLRRLWRVNIESLMIASVQNIKRLLKPWRPSGNQPDPGGNAALEVVFWQVDRFIICLQHSKQFAFTYAGSAFKICRNVFFNRLNHRLRLATAAFLAFAII
jgi:hypothetical protein